MKNKLREFRKSCDSLGASVVCLKQTAGTFSDFASTGVISGSEILANLTLAFRHIEDAHMRLGKAIQALDGGVSVYED